MSWIRVTENLQQNEGIVPGDPHGRHMIDLISGEDPETPNYCHRLVWLVAQQAGDQRDGVRIGLRRLSFPWDKTSAVHHKDSGPCSGRAGGGR